MYMLLISAGVFIVRHRGAYLVQTPADGKYHQQCQYHQHGSTAVLRMARCHYPPNRLVQLISHVDSSISLSTKYEARAIP